MPRSASVFRAAGRLVPALLALVVGASPVAAGGHGGRAADLVTPAAAGLAPYPSHCTGWPDPLLRANDLLANRWRIGPHRVVTLPANRAWNENPLRDANWQYMDHSLIVVHSLLATYATTDDPRYRDRAVAILKDWLADNPRANPRSAWAWNDQGTAMRAVVLACATGYVAIEPWLRSALELHGRTLASELFYVDHGNHALNQSLGLLEVGAVLNRPDWRALAAKRLGVLAAASIDSQGVTNEQSVLYQNYNHRRYRLAERRLVELGLPVPASFARLGQMPKFLGFAILPNGEYEMLGDTDRAKAPAIAGTWAEFAATQGRSGPMPPDTAILYRAGYLFARSGWGTARPFVDEVALSLRWGRSPIIHGHADHGSLTLYGHGSRLLIDPGKFTYNANAYRTWFRGRTAHNVVTVDGAPWRWAASSPLLDSGKSATMDTARIRMTGNPGVTHVRRVTFSRGLHYVLVEDRLTSPTRRTYRQLWHLTEDADPLVAATSFRTRRGKGNVLVRQLVGGTTSRVVVGRTAPIQGWLAWEHGKRLRAPVVEVVRSGTNVRYLTLIVPAAGSPSASVSGLRLTATGYSVVIRIGSRSERVVADGAKVTVTPLE